MIEISRVDHVVTAESLLRLSEWTIRDDVAANGGCGRCRLKRVTTQQRAAKIGHLAGEPVVRLKHLLQPGGVQGGVLVFVLVDQDHVPGHNRSLLLTDSSCLGRRPLTSRRTALARINSS